MIYEQLLEAKRHIDNGSIGNLRIALILLDNAAELLMFNILRLRFERDDYFAHFRKQMLQAGMDIPDYLVVVYTPEERCRAETEFEPMLKILEHRTKQLTSQHRTTLSIAHKMRRDAFHRGQIRSEILNPVCRHLFVTVVEAAGRFALDENVRSSFDDEQKKLWSSFRGGSFLHLRSTIVFDAESLSKSLSTDLIQRIDALSKQIKSFFDSDAEADDYFLRMQFVDAHEPKIHEWTESERDERFLIWHCDESSLVSVKILSHLRRKLSNILKRPPTTALTQYWALDKRLRPIELKVTRYILNLDRAIERQIDIARGK